MSARLQVDTILEGKIVKIKPFGVIVSLGEYGQGLVHISQISESFVQDINDIVAIGDIVKVKVLSVDGESGKITLSMKAVESEGGVQKQRQQAFGNDGFKPDYQKRFNNDTKDSRAVAGEPTFDEKLKDWIKQSNERQAGINKRNNRR